jgi:hypothetical protein
MTQKYGSHNGINHAINKNTQKHTLCGANRNESDDEQSQDLEAVSHLHILIINLFTGNRKLSEISDEKLSVHSFMFTCNHRGIQPQPY